MERFVDWFKSQNGTIDTGSMTLADIPGQGRGAIATRDIPKGHSLFTIPRDLTLSMRTSTLPELMGDSAWRKFQLHKGWIGLILCMMWEEARGNESKWFEYLRNMPTEFTTPMFWSPEELEELAGTTILEKIGKEEAEKDYKEKLIPATKSRPDLFYSAHLEMHYSVQNYHIMGSRILSRSFHVERWESNEGDEKEEENETGTAQDGMEVDTNHAEANELQASESLEEAEDEDDSDDDEDKEDPTDVAMVPMADILNARYGSENAKLFYEPTELKMITTKEIKAGEQIYNTYGDPPNADLLRRYGHVDVIPASEGGDGEGNLADEVEVPADISLTIVAERLKLEANDESLKGRVDWWLEEGGDDIFVLKRDLAPPEGLISFTKLLLYPTPEWEKAKAKSKPPKPKLDDDVLPVLFDVLQKRLSQYPTTAEEDAKFLQDSSLSFNKRNAIIVRLAEKRILSAYLDKMEKLKDELSSGNMKKRDKEKRKRTEENRSENDKRKKR